MPIGKTGIGTVHEGEFLVQLDADTSHATAAHGGWLGELFDVVATDPNFAGSNRMSLATTGIVIEIRYIATN